MNRRSAALSVLASYLLLAGCQQAHEPVQTAREDVHRAEVPPQTESQPGATESANHTLPANSALSPGGDSLQSQTYSIPPSANVQFELQARLIEAIPGDTIQLDAGRYELHRQLDVAADNVTIRGRGANQTVLTFKGLATSGQGLEVTGNNFTLENLAVEDTPGNAVKVVGSRNVTFRGVRVEWTGEPTAANGAYGLYPVQCENVLLENCTAIGASDAGVYVGQCRNVIVRSCRAERNVAGIEIENTIGADVYENVATNNAGGLLVFDMAGLPQKAGKDVRVYRNEVIGNNHPNFADPGAVVAAVPSGSGIMVMASDSVEIFDNQIDQNQTASVLVVSYTVIEEKVSDPTFDPIPEQISIHDNHISNGGTKPTGRIAELLIPVLGPRFPDILWDGMTKPGAEQASLNIANNGDATFANFNLPLLTPENLVAGKYAVATDVAVHDAVLEPLASITLKPHEPPASGISPAVQFYRSVPKLLSEHRLFAEPMAQQRPSDGVVLYDLNTPLFSDYSHKRRFIRLPPGQQMQYREQEVLEFPVGTVMAKTFSYPHDMRDLAQGERLVETRVQIREEDGWYGVTYAWNDEQTDATLVVGGSQLDVSWIHSNGESRSTSYQIPNANQCLNCHGQNKTYQPIGPTARNLNRDSPVGENPPNQLAYLAESGLLDGLPDLSGVATMPQFDNPHSGSIDGRARAWLEINCAHCHNPQGTARTTGLDLRGEQTELGKLGLWKNPVAAGHGAGGRKYDLVPGKPDESILMFRLETPDPSVMMPNIGRRMIPTEAVALVREWIEGLKDPNAE